MRCVLFPPWPEHSSFYWILVGKLRINCLPALRRFLNICAHYDTWTSIWNSWHVSMLCFHFSLSLNSVILSASRKPYGLYNWGWMEVFNTYMLAMFWEVAVYDLVKSNLRYLVISSLWSLHKKNTLMIGLLHLASLWWINLLCIYTFWIFF